MSTFKVLTFNTFKFGGPVAPERVIERILALEPDVVGFQEVFNTRLSIGIRARNARRLLEQGLEPRGFGTRWQPASSPGPFSPLVFNKFRDGILTAARRSTWDFDLGKDYFSQRLNDTTFKRRVIQGLVLTEKGAGTKIAFFNTHLSVGTTDEVRDRRKDEIARALAFIGRIEAEHRPAASILVGDFNAVKDEIGPTLLDLAPTARFQDTWAESNLGEPPESGNTIDVGNTLIQARPPDRRRESMRIDYVLLRPHPGEREAGAAAVEPVSSQVRLAAKEQVVRDGVGSEENLSDHYGVLTEFRVTPVAA